VLAKESEHVEAKFIEGFVLVDLFDLIEDLQASIRIGGSRGWRLESLAVANRILGLFLREIKAEFKQFEG
jgi:hypothetical protein